MCRVLGVRCLPRVLGMRWATLRIVCRLGELPDQLIASEQRTSNDTALSMFSKSPVQGANASEIIPQ